MDNDMDEAGIVFLRFSAQMKRWNETFFLPMREDAAAAAEQAIAELTSIFDQYVWPDSARGQERLKNPATSQPSDYDPDTDTIEDRETAKSDIIFYVQTNTGFMDRFRYTMVKRNHVWKLFRREVFNDLLQKWISHHI